MVIVAPAADRIAGSVALKNDPRWLASEKPRTHTVLLGQQNDISARLRQLLEPDTMVYISTKSQAKLVVSGKGRRFQRRKLAVRTSHPTLRRMSVGGSSRPFHAVSWSTSCSSLVGKPLARLSGV